MLLATNKGWFLLFLDPLQLLVGFLAISASSLATTIRVQPQTKYCSRMISVKGNHTPELWFYIGFYHFLHNPASSIKGLHSLWQCRLFIDSPGAKLLLRPLQCAINNPLIMMSWQFLETDWCSVVRWRLHHSYKTKNHSIPLTWADPGPDFKMILR